MAPRARQQESDADEDVFDLDAVKHEASEAPFRFRAGSTTFTTIGPDEIDWERNAAIPDERSSSADYRPLLRVILGTEEQYTDLVKLHLPRYKVLAIIDGYYKHWGVSGAES